MAHAASTGRDGGRRVSRRGVLLSGLAVLAAGGGGVAIGALQHLHTAELPPAPAELVAALAAERSLIASIDATTGGSPSVRAALVHVRADHAAHQDALRAALATYRPAASASASLPPAAALHLAELRAAEAQASTRAAARAAAITGRTAALLASISACEASHAELLA
ncbi:MAG: hypothetical protein JWP40_2025 [Blastococcus sp.]|nr:hypothetical protein [Blastococcus sp.]